MRPFRNTCSLNMKANMAAIETGAGGVLIKIFGVPLIAGSVAAALTFLFMWPKTLHEAFVRFSCSILTSFVVGPFLLIALYLWSPGLFEAAKPVTRMLGVDPALSVVFIAPPVLVIVAIPAWWIVGGLMLWLEKRKDKDLGEIAHDAAEAVRDVRGAL